MFCLKSNRLRVEIQEPGEAPNDGFRFERGGFISEVVLDGARHFCASEPKNLKHPSSGGRGFCSEYTVDYSAEAGEGEYYPKLGVGLIRKSGAYCFYERYRDVKEFPVRFSHDVMSAEFVTEPLPCLGYAVRIVKKISVENMTITMVTTMENMGEKEIRTEEYCHNFLSIDGMAISSDYHLQFPALRLNEEGKSALVCRQPCNFVSTENGVDFAGCDTAVSMAFISVNGAEVPFEWKLSHNGAKACVEGRDEIKVSGITLWAVDHIVSPEIFHEIVLQPGENACWKRCLTFRVEN